MKAIKQLVQIVGDTSITGVGILALAGSALVLPACGFSFDKIVPVDTPQPLVELGYPETMSLYEARERHALWRAEWTIADQ